MLGARAPARNRGLSLSGNVSIGGVRRPRIDGAASSGLTKPRDVSTLRAISPGRSEAAMFNSTILDVIIGLVFCFASVALFVSAISEFVASALKLRHKTLLTGIQKLLNDPQGTGLVKTLYEHAMINPLALYVPPTAAVPGPQERAAAAAPAAAPLPPRPVEPTWPAWAKRQIPAYISSRDFAHALLDIIQSGPGRYADIGAAIAGEIADPQLRQALLGIATRAQGRIDKFTDGVADWFDNSMDRLSGSYKRRMQMWTFVVGFATAAVFNIDAFYVLGQLWERPALAAAITSQGGTELVAAVAASEKAAAQAGVAGAEAASPPAAGASAPKSGAIPTRELIDRLDTLPVGWGQKRAYPAWDSARPWAFLGFYLSFVVGLAITASSAVFGAPFWFDLLQRLIQIRGTGARPPSNREREEAENRPA
jgi:hypothetical protein